MIRLAPKDARQNDCIKDTAVELSDSSIVFYNKDHSKEFGIRSIEGVTSGVTSGVYWADNQNHTVLVQLFAQEVPERVFEIFFKKEDFEKLFKGAPWDWDSYWFSLRMSAWN